MRNLVLAIAVSGVAIAAASPAVAQYYPRQAYGYGNPYNGGGDYLRRLENVRRSLGSVSPDLGYRLDAEARTLEGQVQIAARNGLGPNETHYFDTRVTQLELRLGQAVNSNRYGNGYNGYYGNRGYGRWNRDNDDRD